MLEFEDIVYLDVQKTGSTYIRKFLQRFARTPEISGVKHKAVVHYDEKKLYIISCRDPLRQYLSLYAYGCQGLGTFRFKKEKVGIDHLYDGTIAGFTGWLELIVPASTGRKYMTGLNRHRLLELFGVQTLRFLRLALPSYREVFETIERKSDVKDRLKSQGLMDFLIKQETLTTDLARLVSGEHAGRFKDLDAVEKYLAETGKINRTPDFGIDVTALSPEVLALVQEREWFFFETLGYPLYV